MRRISITMFEIKTEQLLKYHLHFQEIVTVNESSGFTMRNLSTSSNPIREIKNVPSPFRGKLFIIFAKIHSLTKHFKNFTHPSRTATTLLAVQRRIKSSHFLSLERNFGGDGDDDDVDDNSRNVKNSPRNG